MPRITNRPQVAPLFLVAFAALPFWCGCGNRPNQESPMGASKGERESSGAKTTQPTTLVANDAVSRRRVVKPRIELDTVKSTTRKPYPPPEVEATTNRAINSANRSLPESTGTVTGRVSLLGKTPPARRITVTKNEDVCGVAKGETHDVVVSADGGLKNVVVEILGIDPGQNGFAWKHQEDGYVLRQKGCQFGPPLLVMPTGEKLTVVNDDPIGHNVNSGQWNEQQPGGGAPIVRQLSGTRPVRVGCNVHSWMEAWVYLARSPFYAITDADGEYQIEDVPPGDYRVTFWHASLRPTREKVTLSAGQVLQQEVTFKSPIRN